jgi:uncharacterized DUF497 family protein
MTPEQATYELRAMVVKGVRISWEIPHAMEPAIERDVPTFEAERVVRMGTVVKTEPDADGSTRWRVAGTDSDGRPVHVVVKSVRNVLRVVTVIRTDE